MTIRNAGIGFQNPAGNGRQAMARRIALAQLLMTLSLAACLAVAMVAVSFGIAIAHG